MGSSATPAVAAAATVASSVAPATSPERNRNRRSTLLNSMIGRGCHPPPEAAGSIATSSARTATMAARWLPRGCGAWNPRTVRTKPTASSRRIHRGGAAPPVPAAGAGDTSSSSTAVSPLQHPPPPNNNTEENEAATSTTSPPFKTTTTTTTLPEKLGSWVPIQRQERKRFGALTFMMFLFIYVYTTARDTKDTLVVSNCGAEAIPFLKLYGVMPSAFLFILVYGKLSQTYSKAHVFYATLFPFFSFFAVFAFGLYPNRDLIHMTTASTSSNSSPAIQLLHYWSYALYFIVSELWASAGVPLLFWQVANDITSVEEATRFYPLLAVLGQVAPIVSGYVMKYIVAQQPREAPDGGFGHTLQALAVIKVLCGIAIVLLYQYVYRSMESHPNGTTSTTVTVEETFTTASANTTRTTSTTPTHTPRHTTTPSKKPKVSLWESVHALSKSPELQNMAIMVFGYNVCVELTEVVWKNIVRQTHPTETAYMHFMATFSQRVGILAFVLQVSASSIIQRLGWTRASQLTPMTMWAVAGPFFLLVALSQQYPATIPLSLVLTVGTWQNIINKIGKYSLFDPLKEMAYIPLPADAKSNGKAAIDVLGARCGRSLSAGLQQILVVVSRSGSLVQCAPVLGVVYTGMIGAWLTAIHQLGTLFETTNTMTTTTTTNTIPAAAPSPTSQSRPEEAPPRSSPHDDDFLTSQNELGTSVLDDIDKRNNHTR